MSHQAFAHKRAPSHIRTLLIWVLAAWTCSAANGLSERCRVILTKESNTTYTTRAASCVMSELEDMTKGYSVLRVLPYYTGTLLFMKGMQDKLQNFMAQSKGFGSLMLVMLTGVFTTAMFEYFYCSVWPLSGLDWLGPQWSAFETKAACLVLEDMGSWRLLCLAYVCAALLFTPLILLPPLPSTSQAMLARFDSYVGDKIRSAKFVHRKQHSCWNRFWLRTYVFLFVLQVFTLYSVYHFAFVNETFLELVPLIENNTETALESTLALMLPAESAQDFKKTRAMEQVMLVADPQVRAFLVTLVYLVLSWGQFIIVYDRLIERSFQDDFPTMILILTFPCLGRFRLFAGKLWSRLSGMGTSIEHMLALAEQASEQIEQAPDVFKDMSKKVEARFKELKDFVRQSAEKTKNETGVAIRDSIDSLLSVSRNEAWHMGQLLGTELLELAESKEFWNTCREFTVVGEEDLFSRDEEQTCWTKVHDCFTCSNLNAKSGNLDLLPGDPDQFAQALSDTFQRGLQTVLDQAESRLQEIGDDVDERKNEFIDGVSINICSKISEISEFIKHHADIVLDELQDLAMYSSKLSCKIHSLVENTKEMIGGVRGVHNTSEQLVRAVLMLPCLQTWPWFLFYGVAGVATYIVCTLAVIATVSSLLAARLAGLMPLSDWLWFRWGFSFLILGALVVYIMFMMRYWFMAMTGQLQSIRGNWLTGNDGIQSGGSRSSREYYSQAHKDEWSESENGCDLQACGVGCTPVLATFVFMAVTVAVVYVLYLLYLQHERNADILQDVCQVFNNSVGVPTANNIAAMP